MKQRHVGRSMHCWGYCEKISLSVYAGFADIFDCKSFRMGWFAFLTDA